MILTALASGKKISFVLDEHQVVITSICLRFVISLEKAMCYGISSLNPFSDAEKLNPEEIDY
jgi:hypothetical protein